ncbi:nucleosome assembly protein [Aspergillus oryzae 100-8]|uniref:Nucleosome assembly protein n=1 Tax=Aspergillus oryzae (strain 3.042) TaxID=1160506 RepID=I7ZZZ8_ASPO3|nr:nucleosome assembly protein [Aspergillus oryzae 3.042]KDE79404.1 nucleosome assembly protein [Aspergillus oryzae 100-8]|eukprot:EIT77892.1 nucleosome assembly protein [Aspergillus oryzae 3.042]
MATPDPHPDLKALYDKENELNAQWEHDIHEARKIHYEHNKSFYQHRAELATGWTGDTQTHHPPIRDFWLTALRNEHETRKLVTKLDLGPLKSLIDIRVEWLEGFDYVLAFYFAPNEYFTNRMMRKEFYYDKTGEPTPNPSPLEMRGDRIHWKKNHILQAECHARIGTKSFFAFVSRSLAYGDAQTSEEESMEDARITEDFEMGESIRDSVQPYAMELNSKAFGLEEDGVGEEAEEAEEEDDEDIDYDME